MAEPKMEPCCAKFSTQIRRATADVNAAARNAVRRGGTPKSLAQVAQAKAQLASTKRHLEDHDAEHARVGAAA